MVIDFKNEHVMQSILNNKVKSLIPNRIQAVVNNLRETINFKETETRNSFMGIYRSTFTGQ